MFRNDRQVARALRVLLAPLRLGDLWTDDGPTADAVELSFDAAVRGSDGSTIERLSQRSCGQTEEVSSGLEGDPAKRRRGFSGALGLIQS